MNRSRRRTDRPSGPTGCPQQQQTVPSKPNRLSRSFRQTQTQTAAEVDPPKNQPPDFKTPTRMPRSRAAGGFTGESPNNDSDFQQDIIWDATSPSPNRLGKRGKKQPAGVVNISEIVSRIAPKYGRPKVAEPTLQQWIGDSATIPCTPDVQAPKPKKKSPRPNGVDDLLKLAKQFDFNMFRQDEEEEEEVEDMHQQSQELLSGDILDFENRDQNFFSPSLPADCGPAVTVAAGTGLQLRLDQDMENDLDFLFDGPTQHLSGKLSQPSQVKPASKEAPGKPSASSQKSASGVSTTTAKGTAAKEEFEDDWENDDLLNDSLVLEMTQNPLKFTSPKCCSTQKAPSQIRHPNAVIQSAVSDVEKDNVRQRMTFKQESNPDFSVRRVQTDTWINSRVDYKSKMADKNMQQNIFSSSNSGSVEVGWQRSGQTSNSVKSDPQKPQFHHRTSVAQYNTPASNTAVTKTSQSFPIKPAVVSSHSEAPAVSDLLDDDLSSFFSSDLVWDDPADDDLLREICEDVENHMQNVENISTKPPGRHSSNQRASLQPFNRNHQPTNQQPFVPKKQTATTFPCTLGRPAGSSLAAGVVFDVAAGAQTKDPLRRSQAGSSSTRVLSAHRKDQFTFKKPNNPVSMVTSKGEVKCSAAEIELKKQQAMERRRQRLQAAHNLRAPT